MSSPPSSQGCSEGNHTATSCRSPVAVLLGSKGIVHVCKKHLRLYSEILSAKIEKDDGNAFILNLENEDPEIFSHVRKWLYTRTLTSALLEIVDLTLDSPDSPSEGPENGLKAQRKLAAKKKRDLNTFEHVTTRLLELYIFGQKYGVSKLRDDVMTALVQYQLEKRMIPRPAFICRAYQELPPDCKLCTYLKIAAAHYWNPLNISESEQQLRESCPGSFLYALYVREKLSTVNRHKAPQHERDICLLHEHGIDGEALCKENQDRIGRKEQSASPRKRERAVSGESSAKNSPKATRGKEILASSKKFKQNGN